MPRVGRVTYELGSPPVLGTHPCVRRFENTIAHALGVYDALKARAGDRAGLGGRPRQLRVLAVPALPLRVPDHQLLRVLLPARRARPWLPAGAARGGDGPAALRCRQRDDAAGPGELRPRLDTDSAPARGPGCRRHTGARWMRCTTGSIRSCTGAGMSAPPPRRHGRPRGHPHCHLRHARVRDAAPGSTCSWRRRGASSSRSPMSYSPSRAEIEIWYGNAVQCAGHRTFRERCWRRGSTTRRSSGSSAWSRRTRWRICYWVSDLHVYLTVPFFTSWSPLEAMSCSCVLLASDQACVREYLTHAQNGLLCDFYDVETMARRAVDAEAPRSHTATLARRRGGRSSGRTRWTRRCRGSRRCSKRSRPRGPHAERAGGTASPPVGRRGGRVRAVRARDTAARPCGFGGICRRGRGQRPLLRRLDPVRRGRAGRREWPLTPTLSPPYKGEGAGAEDRLFCWELGGGLGHMMQMRPLAEDLAGAGHTVLSRCVNWSGRKRSSAAPTSRSSRRRRGPPTARAAAARPGHVHATADERRLRRRRRAVGPRSAWREPLPAVRAGPRRLRPCATALLASRGLPLRRAAGRLGVLCAAGR